MGLVLSLLLLALLFRGVGLLVEDLKWALVVAFALLLVGAFTGYRERSRIWVRVHQRDCPVGATAEWWSSPPPRHPQHQGFSRHEGTGL